MTRLTNDMRETIRHAALEFAFAPRAEALKAQEDALARKAYAVVFPADELKAVAKVPSNWFRNDSCLRFNVAGRAIRLQTTDDGLPVPYRMKDEEEGRWSCHQSLGTIHAGDLADEIQANADAKEELKTQCYAASAQTKSLLFSVTTIKRLREAWPEGEAFYAPLEEGNPSSLPALRTDELNAMLGLSPA